MPEQSSIDRLAGLDQQINLIDLLKNIDEELTQFRDALSLPSTGDATADYEVGQLKSLLEELSDQLRWHADPLNQASGRAGQFTHAIQSITRMAQVLHDRETMTGAEAAEALNDLWGHWTGALPLIASVNPVLGAYFTLIGKALESTAIVAAQLEARRDEQLDAIEGTLDEIQAGAPKDGDPDAVRAALDGELHRLEWERGLLIQQRREVNWRAARERCAYDREVDKDYPRRLTERCRAHMERVGERMRVQMHREESDPAEVAAIHAMWDDPRYLTDLEWLRDYWRCVRKWVLWAEEHIAFWKRPAVQVVAALLVVALGIGAVAVLRNGSDEVTRPPDAAITTAVGVTSATVAATTAPATTTTLSSATTDATAPSTTTTAPPAPPPPSFRYSWQGAEAPDYDWADVAALTQAELRELGTGISIPGFQIPNDPTGAFFPFPGVQWLLEPPEEPDENTISYCANSHYTGPLGLAMDGTLVPEPEGDCAWTGPETGGGVITLSGEQLADWMELFGD